jgi:hypothetical protein
VGASTIERVASLLVTIELTPSLSDSGWSPLFVVVGVTGSDVPFLLKSVGLINDSLRDELNTKKSRSFS